MFFICVKRGRKRNEWEIWKDNECEWKHMDGCKPIADISLQRNAYQTITYYTIHPTIMIIWKWEHTQRAAQNIAMALWFNETLILCRVFTCITGPKDYFQKQVYSKEGSSSDLLLNWVTSLKIFNNLSEIWTQIVWKQ